MARHLGDQRSTAAFSGWEVPHLIKMFSSTVTFSPDYAMNSTERRTAVIEVKVLEREPDERTLIEAAQSEPARFADLYDRNFERIYAFFARRVSTRDEAQDLTAEVFHQALASIKGFKWQEAPFVAWLYGIAAHVLASHWQKLGNNTVIENLELCGVSDEIERSVILGQLVDSLPPDQRLVIVGRFAHQKSVREIALELGRSEGAIKQLQLRALENLRKRLEGRT
jgi:RNA polymerase sigma factor (sigma-70 family)